MRSTSDDVEFGFISSLFDLQGKNSGVCLYLPRCQDSIQYTDRDRDREPMNVPEAIHHPAQPSRWNLIIMTLVDYASSDGDVDEALVNDAQLPETPSKGP